MTAAACKDQEVLAFDKLVYYRCRTLNGSLHPRILSTLKPEGILWVEVHGPGYVLPHADRGIITALNFYKTAGECTTNFFDALPGKTTTVVQSANNANLISQNDIERVSGFEAQDQEIYLLNVSRIHDVQARGVLREFVQFQWRGASFETIAKRLSTLLAQ